MHKIRYIHDPPEIADIRLQPGNLVFVQDTPHSFDRILAAGSPHDQLADHRVIIDRNLITFIDIAVDSHSDPVRFGQLADNAGRWHEIVGGIFGTDPAFDSMPTLGYIFLPDMQRFVVGNTKLLLYQVEPQHLFGNRMLHLQTGVHFEKIKITVFINQELDRPGTGIVDGLSSRNRLLAHLFPQFRRNERRRTFLDNFLVTALHRAFAFAEMDHIPVIVA